MSICEFTPLAGARTDATDDPARSRSKLDHSRRIFDIDLDNPTALPSRKRRNEDDVDTVWMVHWLNAKCTISNAKSCLKYRDCVANKDVFLNRCRSPITAVTVVNKLERYSSTPSRFGFMFYPYQQYDSIDEILNLQVSLDVHLQVPIFQEIGNLSSLLKLRIKMNSELTSLPAALGKLSSLRELSICTNYLLTTLPAELGQLANLRKLEIRDDDSLTTLPGELGNLSNLHTLEIGCNSLTSLPAELGLLSNLHELKVVWNASLAALPAELGNLSSLHNLTIKDNWSLATLPAGLGRLSSLQNLIITGNDSLTSLPAELGRLSSLQYLSIERNKSLVSLPAELGSLAKLKRLTIAENVSLAGLPDGLRKLKNFNWSVVDFEVVNPFVMSEAN